MDIVTGAFVFLFYVAAFFLSLSVFEWIVIAIREERRPRYQSAMRDWKP